MKNPVLKLFIIYMIGVATTYQIHYASQRTYYSEIMRDYNNAAVQLNIDRTAMFDGIAAGVIWPLFWLSKTTKVFLNYTDGVKGE